MFTYPFGLIDSDQFTRNELIALKPLMKSKCIRPAHEFESVFAQMIAYRLNKVEMYTRIVGSTRRAPAEVLNQYPTSWLAQRRNFSQYKIVFFQDKLKQFLNNLTKRQPHAKTCSTINKDPIGLPNNMVVVFGKTTFSVIINSEKALFVECPISQSTPKDIVKLKRYFSRLIKAAYHSNINLVMPRECEPNTPLKLALPISMSYQCKTCSGFYIDGNLLAQSFNFTPVTLAHRFREMAPANSFVEQAMAAAHNSTFTVPLIQSVLDETLNVTPLKTPVNDSPLVHVMSNIYEISGNGLHFIISKHTLAKLRQQDSTAALDPLIVKPYQSQSDAA